MSRTAVIAASTALVVASLTVGWAQEPLAPFTRTERFVGTLALQRPRPQQVSAAIHQWIIRGRQKIAALELPVQGTMIVQLRGGSLITVIGGQRRERAEGEFWTVPAGTAMGIETEDDSAIIQTMILSNQR